MGPASKQPIVVVVGAPESKTLVQPLRPPVGALRAETDTPRPPLAHRIDRTPERFEAEAAGLPARRHGDAVKMPPTGEERDARIADSLSVNFDQRNFDARCAQIDIELEPGWKTYWRDPGDAGVPPSIDVSGSANITAARLDFPPPSRHDGGGFQWAGYDHPVALPIAFQVKSPGQPAVISAEIFLGVCETICIPVQATLTVDPASDSENPEDAAAVTAALAALPGPARPDFGIKTVSEPGASTVLLEAVFPGDPQSAGRSSYTVA